MMFQHRTMLLLVIITLLAAMLACNLPGFSAREPEATPIPVTTEAVLDLSTQVVQAAATAQAGGPITLEMTEQQLTSAAALELQAQNQTDLRNVQVRLRDGLMIISGTTNQGGFDLPVTISLRPTVDANGVPHSQVVEATVGPFDLPAAVITEIQNRVDQTIQQQLNATAGAVSVDSITIADGKMTVLAHRR